MIHARALVALVSVPLAAAAARADDLPARFEPLRKAGVVRVLGEPGLLERRGVAALEPVPGASRVVVATSDGSVALWDLEARDAVAALSTGAGAAPTALAVAPDGRRVVVGDAEGAVRALDLEGRTVELRAAGPRLLAVALSGERVLAVDASGALLAWRGGAAVASPGAGPTTEPRVAAVAPDLQAVFVAGAGPRGPRGWLFAPGAAAGEPLIDVDVRAAEGFEEVVIARLGAGQLVVAQEGRLSAWDARRRRWSRRYVDRDGKPRPLAKAQALAVLADGRIVEAVDGELVTRDAASGDPIASTVLVGPLAALAATPRGVLVGRAAAAGSLLAEEDPDARPTLVLLEPERLRPARARAGHTEAVEALAAGGGALVSASAGEVIVWDLAAGRPRLRAPLSSWPRSLAVSADGRRALVGSGGPGFDCEGDEPPPTPLLVLDLERGAEVRSTFTLDGARFEQGVDAVALSPDGQRAVVAGEGGAWLVDVEAGTLTLVGPPSSAVALRPGGAAALVAGADGLVEVELAGGRARKVDDVARPSLAAGADGALAWVGDEEGTIARAGGGPLAGHEGAVERLAFAGDRLASLGADRTVRLWSLATGAQAAALDLRPTGDVPTALAAEGRTLFVGTRDGVILRVEPR